MGALACVVSGLISTEDAFKKVNWNVVGMLGALLAVSEGFNNCGAGELCVEIMFKIFGENASPFVLYAVIMLIALIITNIIDNIAAQALIAPIALSIA